jgi:DNA polymerase-3 subunit delta'
MSTAVQGQSANDVPARPSPEEVAEGLHPALNRWLLGQDAAEQRLVGALEGDNLHHAWLLAGPPGIGKATLGYRFARRLLAGDEGAGGGLFGDAPEGLDVPLDSPAFTEVASGSHPNLLRLTRPWDFKTKKYRTGIPVDDVRSLTGFLGQRANRRGRRVVIVDAADDLTESAENALLKPLEEPPADTVFILVSHQPGSLLPTIRSRCRRLDMRPPDPASALEVLTRLTPEIESASASVLLALSGNAPGGALRLNGSGGLEMYGQVLQLFRQLPRRSQDLVQKITAGMERGAESERRFDLFCDLLDGILRRMIAASVNGGNAIPEALDGEREFAVSQSGGGLDQWFDLCDNLRRLRERTGAVHLNRKAVTLTLVSALEAAAQRAAN